jgi:hypothetical protein
MDNVVVSKILGESSDWDLFLLTKKLAAILNRFEGADIEDTSPYTPDWAEGTEYDTSEETKDLRELRHSIFEWAAEAGNLLPGNKAVRSIVWHVRHHMHHQPGDCLYNLSSPWAEFLGNNPQGPQLAHEIVGWSGRRKYRAVSNSTLLDVLYGNTLGDVED